VEAAQIPRQWIAWICGCQRQLRYIAGIYPTAISRETLEEKYLIVIAVRTEDLKKPVHKRYQKSN